MDLSTQGYFENVQFQDEMKHGPFQKWLHTPSFSPDPDGECLMEDRIEYSIFPISVSYTHMTLPTTTRY